MLMKFGIYGGLKVLSIYLNEGRKEYWHKQNGYLARHWHSRNVTFFKNK